MPYNTGTQAKETMQVTLIPNFTYVEETELICALGHSVAFMKQLADDSVDNKSYWMRRAETFEKLADKLIKETHNFYYNK